MGDAALQRFKRDMDNFEKAASRITASTAYDGGTEPAALAWLLTFLAVKDKDAVRLNEWQREEAFWNVYRFAFDGGQTERTDFSRMGAINLSYPETAAERTTMMAQIQRDARAALTDYVRTGVGTFPKGEAAFSLMRHGNPPLAYRGGDLASSFYYMAAQLLSRYRHRVKQCEGCPLIMLIGRKDQRFHSQSCQILTFVRKKRAKEKAERLAKEAAKKLRKRKKTLASHTGGKRHDGKPNKEG